MRVRTYRSRWQQAQAEETRALLGVWEAAGVLRGLPDIPTPSTATLQPPAMTAGSILAMLVAE